MYGWFYLNNMNAFIYLKQYVAISNTYYIHGILFFVLFFFAHWSIHVYFPGAAGYYLWRSPSLSGLFSVKNLDSAVLYKTDQIKI